MKSYRNLTTVLILICCLTLGLTVFLSENTFTDAPFLPALLNISVAIFSISMVALAISIVMYFNTKNTLIATLKRRAGRVYEELLHHKMKLVDATDGVDCFYRVNCVLFDDTSFSRIRKFLDEEFFLLLHFEPLFDSKAAVAAVNDFASLHKELGYVVRSYANDKSEFQKFEANYAKVHGTRMKRVTHEENLLHPELRDDYEQMFTAYEYAMYNIDNILTFIDARLQVLDRYYKTGPNWATVKALLNEEFHHWLANKPRNMN